MKCEKQKDRLTKIYSQVEQQPGKNAGSIARLLGLNRSEITRALPIMEDEGLLLSEDEHGHLWPAKHDSKSKIPPISPQIDY